MAIETETVAHQAREMAPEIEVTHDDKEVKGHIVSQTQDPEIGSIEEP